MKVLHTIASLCPDGGGPSYTVPRLAEATVGHGWEAEIATLRTPNSITDRGVPIRRFEQDAMPIAYLSRLGRSRFFDNGLNELDATVIHTHGLWTMPNVYPARLAGNRGIPFVLSPRGMLGDAALKFSSLKKRLFWHIWQSKAMSQVDCLHATAESELDDIRNFGINSPVAIVPNGVDLPAGSYLGNTNVSQAPYVLSLGRLHPKKGLESLITAFAQVSSTYPDWHLRLVGIDEGGYSEQLRSMINAAGLAERASVEGPVFGDAKKELMARAKLFALPSLHENFAVTVAESLALGTPVISSKGAPWSDLLTHKCGWWIDHGPSPLAATLHNAMALSDVERVQMGLRGRAWMAEEFHWDGIGARMVEVYEWLLGHRPRPTFVCHSEA